MARAFESFIKVAVVAVPVLATWLIGLEVRLRTIEGNRFTSRNGMEIRKEIAALREKVGQLPPSELLERVARLEAQAAERWQSMDKRISEILAELRALRKE